MLYYIHGYQSSPSGEKAALLKATLHAIPIAYRESVPEELVISECLSRISEAIANDQQVILIGSSLGGFLAASTALTHSTVKQLILLNPAIIPSELDLNTIEGMPLRILQEMRDPRLFQQKIKATITILRGTLDDIVPDEWILTFAQAQNATIRLYTDDHRFSKNMSRLPEIISELIQQ
ncbi:MAG TPA: YqiA/YcfP family alpha/beta fold hydrolase [Candidatus Thermoplasmatota archaeon]|nr:YqiA/YcfP family alpha/beta fold hydrolase [Candidatus Thermoplasmatota archaeon]